MTLITSFRCADGGVLLCADKERSDAIGKRAVEKLFRIRTNQGSFLIAGSGRSSIVDNTLMRLESELKQRGDDPNVVLFDKHKDIIETVLYEIHEEYIWGNRDESNRQIRLIVAAAFRSPYSTPIVYGTDEEILVPQQLYGCAGAGQDLAYYFADKLYNDHLSREGATLINAFIFREVSRVVSGVGLGVDMWFLAAKDQAWYRLSPEKVEELQSIIPDIGSSISDAWNVKIQIPAWLTQFFT